MKKLFLIFITVIFMFAFLGCVGKNTYTPPDGCVNKDGMVEKSVILEHIDYPRETALVLKTASTIVASETSLSHVKEMIAVIEVTKAMLGNSTYSGIASYLLDEISKLRSEYSVQLMIVTQQCQDMVNIKLPIYECDKILLRKHLNEQKALLKQYLLE